MKRLSICILTASLLASCTEPVTVQVSDTQTGEPAADVLVQRRRPVNPWEKITNPVGTFYHPRTLAETHWVDQVGQCVVKQVGKEDVLDLYTTSCVPLTVAIGKSTIRLSPGTNLTFSSWAYHIWPEGDGGRFTVTDPSWDWKKEKPNQGIQPTK